MVTIRAQPKSCVKWGVQDFTEKLIPSPFVLNQPVNSVNEQCNEVGLLVHGNLEPPQQLLANLIKGPYREDLANWILEYKSHLLPVTHWLFAWGLDVPDYINHLLNDGACDGLELSLVSALSGTPVNMVQEETVLSTASTGIDFAFPVIMLTAFGVGILCEPEALPVSEEEGINPLPDSGGSAVKKHAGWLVAVEYLASATMTSTSSHSSGSSTGTETETELLMEAPERNYKLPAISGVAKERTCPVCDLVISSGLALVRHIKSEHPDSCSYHYDSYESAYNTVADLHSHISIVHRVPFVHCKFCEYTATTCSQMHQHVWLYTKGKCCSVCSKTYPTLRALLLHRCLHMHHTNFQCEDCDATFKSKVSLATHCKGKHGEGYCCPCGACFASPVQHKQHQKKCNHMLWLWE